MRCGERKEREEKRGREGGEGESERVIQKSAEGSLESLAECWSEHFVRKLPESTEATTQKKQRKRFLELTKARIVCVLTARAASLLYCVASDRVLRRGLPQGRTSSRQVDILVPTNKV